MTAFCKCPVSFLNDSELTWSHILYSDVPWGTKSENKVSSDLCVVETNKGENSDKVAVPTAETDINTDAIHVLSTKPPKEEKKVDAATTQEDYYSNFRTKCATSLPHSRYY